MNIKTIICDIDGTLALHAHRGPFDWDKIGTDEPYEAVRDVLDMMTYHVILVTGREEKYRGETVAWLMKHRVMFHELHMRPTGDRREDSIIKREIYESRIKGKYNVRFVLDDRNRVVKMWREVGLPCFQVAEGDF